MRRVATIVAACLLAATAASAVNLQVGPGRVLLAGGSRYVGPGDVVTGASAWWGLRAYKASYAAGGINPAIDACDTATGLTCTTGIKILPSGQLDVATAQASAACAVSCSVTKLYDQTGNGNHVTQATIAAAPVLTFNCDGALPCLTFTAASSQDLENGTLGPLAVPFSAAGVAGGVTNANGVVVSGTSTASVFRNGANTWGLFSDAGCCTVAATDAGNHSYQGAFANSTGRAGFLSVDGTVTNGYSATSNTPATATFFLMNNQNSNFANGKTMEAGYWPVQFTKPQAHNLCLNQQAYWSTPACAALVTDFLLADTGSDLLVNTGSSFLVQ